MSLNFFFYLSNACCALLPLLFFQATWICQCDSNLVQNLDSEFKTILGAPADLETWAEWLQSVVNKVLIPSSKESRETFVEPARQFLKNWSFYR